MPVLVYTGTIFPKLAIPKEAGPRFDPMDSFPVLQEQEGNWTSPKTVHVAGVRIFQYYTTNPAKLCNAIVNFRTRNDDVFIVSFPKSGMVYVLWLGKFILFLRIFIGISFPGKLIELT